MRVPDGKAHEYRKFTLERIRRPNYGFRWRGVPPQPRMLASALIQRISAILLHPEPRVTINAVSRRVYGDDRAVDGGYAVSG